MQQARWTADGIELVDVPAGPLPEGRVRLKVLANGICGTDLHLYRRELPPLEGSVPGHEIVGVPIDGPAGLTESLYAVEPRVWCGDCDFCGAGDHHLCPNGTVIGIQDAGGLAERVDVPRPSLHPVDADVPPLVASLAEPLAVSLRAVHLARLEADSRVLVLGGGSIGLLSGLLARDRAARVAITARYPQQAEAARRLGLEPLGESEVEAWSGEFGPDVVIETVGGFADTLAEAVQFCRPGGRVVVLGVFAGERTLNALVLMAKEIRLIGSNMYGSTRRGSEFRAAVDLMPRYRAELEPLQTHQFRLSALNDAFKCALDKRSGAIKVTVIPDTAS